MKLLHPSYNLTDIRILQKACQEWKGSPEDMDEGTLFMWTVWTKCPHVSVVIPLLMWMEEYGASLISSRKVLSRLEVICQSLKSWEFKAILQYVIDITNKLGECVGKKVVGFKINSLISLLDLKSQRVKDLSMVHFLAEELAEKDDDILKAMKTAGDLCSEALGSIVEVHVLFPNATLKYFEIVNLLQKMDIEKDKDFIDQMRPFSEKLRQVLIDLNSKLRNIDKDISYFGGIHYDEPSWASNQCVSDIKTAWTKLVTASILEQEEATLRITNDSRRYVFFAEIHKFLTEFHAAQIFNVCKKKKEEQQAKIAEKKQQCDAEKAARDEARQKALEERQKQRQQQIENQEKLPKDILEQIKTNDAEEIIMQETHEQLQTSQVAPRAGLWSKLGFSQCLVNTLKTKQPN